MLTFIPAEGVLQSVKDLLESYDSAGLVDEGYLYPFIREALFDIGLYATEEMEIMLPVHNGKAILPRYVQQVKEVWTLKDNCKHEPLYPLQRKGNTKVYKLAGRTLQLPYTEGFVHVVYEGLSVDEEGIPQVPDDPILLRYVRSKLLYEVLKKWFYDGQVPDITQKFQKAEAEYSVAFREANYYSKLPTWISVIHANRHKQGFTSPYKW